MASIRAVKGFLTRDVSVGYTTYRWASGCPERGGGEVFEVSGFGGGRGSVLRLRGRGTSVALIALTASNQYVRGVPGWHHSLTMMTCDGFAANTSKCRGCD